MGDKYFHGDNFVATPGIHLDPIGFTPLDSPSKWISFDTPKPKFDEELFLTEMGGSRVSNNIAYHLQGGDSALALSNLGRNPHGIDPTGRRFSFYEVYTPNSEHEGVRRFDTVLNPSTDEHRIAQGMSTGEKFSRGLTKGAYTLGKTVAQTFGGTLYGIGSALYNQDASKFYDNEFQRFFHDLDIYTQNIYANYRTNEEKQMQWYEKLGTVNFWADEGLTFAGQIGGMVLSSALMGGMGMSGLGAISNISKGLSVGRMAAAAKTFSIAGGLQQLGLSMLRAGATEGASAALQFKYEALNRALTTMVQNTGKVDEEKFTEYSNRVSELTDGLFLATTGITAVSDVIQFGDVLGVNKFFKPLQGSMVSALYGTSVNKTTAKALQKAFKNGGVEALEKGISELTEASFKRSKSTIAKELLMDKIPEAVSEGLEEGGQGLFEMIAWDALNSQYDPLALGKAKDEVKGRFGGIFDSMRIEDNLSKYVRSDEGAEAVAIGAIFGALGGTIAKTFSGDFSWAKFRSEGSIERAKTWKSVSEIQKLMTNGTFDEATRQAFHDLARGTLTSLSHTASALEQKKMAQKALEEGDYAMASLLEASAAVSTIIPHFQRLFGDPKLKISALDYFDAKIDSMDNEELKRQLGADDETLGKIKDLHKKQYRSMIKNWEKAEDFAHTLSSITPLHNNEAAKEMIARQHYLYLTAKQNSDKFAEQFAELKGFTNSDMVREAMYAAKHRHDEFFKKWGELKRTEGTLIRQERELDAKLTSDNFTGKGKNTDDQGAEGTVVSELEKTRRAMLELQKAKKELEEEKKNFLKDFENFSRYRDFKGVGQGHFKGSINSLKNPLNATFEELSQIFEAIENAGGMVEGLKANAKEHPMAIKADLMLQAFNNMTDAVDTYERFVDDLDNAKENSKLNLLFRKIGDFFGGKVDRSSRKNRNYKKGFEIDANGNKVPVTYDEDEELEFAKAEVLSVMNLKPEDLDEHSHVGKLFNALMRTKLRSDRQRSNAGKIALAVKDPLNIEKEDLIPDEEYRDYVANGLFTVDSNGNYINRPEMEHIITDLVNKLARHQPLSSREAEMVKNYEDFFKTRVSEYKNANLPYTTTTERIMTLVRDSATNSAKNIHLTRKQFVDDGGEEEDLVGYLKAKITKVLEESQALNADSELDNIRPRDPLGEDFGKDLETAQDFVKELTDDNLVDKYLRLKDLQQNLNNLSDVEKVEFKDLINFFNKLSKLRGTDTSSNELGRNGQPSDLLDDIMLLNQLEDLSTRKVSTAVVNKVLDDVQALKLQSGTENSQVNYSQTYSEAVVSIVDVPNGFNLRIHNLTLEGFTNMLNQGLSVRQIMDNEYAVVDGQGQIISFFETDKSGNLVFDVTDNTGNLNLDVLTPLENATGLILTKLYNSQGSYANLYRKQPVGDPKVVESDITIKTVENSISVAGSKVDVEVEKYSLGKGINDAKVAELENRINTLKSDPQSAQQVKDLQLIVDAYKGIQELNGLFIKQAEQGGYLDLKDVARISDIEHLLKDYQKRRKELSDILDDISQKKEAKQDEIDNFTSVNSAKYNFHKEKVEYNSVSEAKGNIGKDLDSQGNIVDTAIRNDKGLNPNTKVSTLRSSYTKETVEKFLALKVLKDGKTVGDIINVTGFDEDKGKVEDVIVKFISRYITAIQNVKYGQSPHQSEKDLYNNLRYLFNKASNLSADKKGNKDLFQKLFVLAKYQELYKHYNDKTFNRKSVEFTTIKDVKIENLDAAAKQRADDDKEALGKLKDELLEINKAYRAVEEGLELFTDVSVKKEKTKVTSQSTNVLTSKQGNYALDKDATRKTKKGEHLRVVYAEGSEYNQTLTDKNEKVKKGVLLLVNQNDKVVGVLKADHLKDGDKGDAFVKGLKAFRADIFKRVNNDKFKKDAKRFQNNPGMIETGVHVPVEFVKDGSPVYSIDNDANIKKFDIPTNLPQGVNIIGYGEYHSAQDYNPTYLERKSGDSDLDKNNFEMVDSLYRQLTNTHQGGKIPSIMYIVIDNHGRRIAYPVEAKSLGGDFSTDLDSILNNPNLSRQERFLNANELMLEYGVNVADRENQQYTFDYENIADPNSKFIADVKDFMKDKVKMFTGNHMQQGTKDEVLKNLRINLDLSKDGFFGTPKFQLGYSKAILDDGSPLSTSTKATKGNTNTGTPTTVNTNNQANC